ncbi:hypothetical protein HPB48_014691 [Haemaphysalis longicornis]|uniref:MH2 domain-containing protein n=1 Tax=Haemaphysalis longicornis TaxID=44386 RepID=A0A9J6GCU0_HAELO|nr:hypothetical protein HPB48_014691 [Haemaphysalis longicornis]
MNTDDEGNWRERRLNGGNGCSRAQPVSRMPTARNLTRTFRRGSSGDHIQEVLNKWGQIDDEIWAKIICMERNRRVAKAYARASVLTINGSNDWLRRLQVSGRSSVIILPCTREACVPYSKCCVCIEAPCPWNEAVYAAITGIVRER